jgi:PAS domain S-box-containing protein
LHANACGAHSVPHSFVLDAARQHIEERMRRAYGGEVRVLLEANPPYEILSVSQAWSNLTGYTPTEVVGKTLTFLRGPATEPAALAALDDALAKEASASVRVTSYDKSDRPFVHILSIEPLRDSAGRPRLFEATSLVHSTRERIERYAPHPSGQQAAHGNTCAPLPSWANIDGHPPCERTSSWSRLGGMSHEELHTPAPAPAPAGADERLHFDGNAPEAATALASSIDTALDDTFIEWLQSGDDSKLKEVDFGSLPWFQGV